MINGYWFNFKRGYITPAGTFKFNRRYVGTPLPNKYTPVILGAAYSPYDLQEHTKALLGASYSLYDLQDHRKAVFGLSYYSLDPFFQEDIE